MYVDTILFLLGGILAVIATSLSIYIIASNKLSRVYRDALRQETEFCDSLTSTAFSNKTESTDKTSLIRENGDTELLENNADTNNPEVYKVVDFDDSVLEGRYVLRGEISGGGMSRVFLADNIKLGNQWIVKFIPSRIGALSKEENVLRLLNHISIPKIIDIFKDEKGVYIVESFVEGVTLKKVIETRQKINESIIVDWAEQLSRVLNYLHRMAPNPIFHLDIKPSNIMITHDNRLVLIDFGISKGTGESGVAAIGVTYSYAAPEQLNYKIPQKYLPIVNSRFGELLSDRLFWKPDARTDIFSLGVILFELAVGQTPKIQNKTLLKDAVSKEMCAIIYKCMMTEPDERYQTANELLLDLQRVKSSKIKMARKLFVRKLATVSAVCAIVMSLGSLIGGYYIYGQENASSLGVEPGVVTVSIQQSSELFVEKKMQDGEIVKLDNSQIKWEFSSDNIARIDGNRVSGINIGETELVGHYRNKRIWLDVHVIEPMEGMVDISQRYQIGHTAQIFIGTEEREHKDGALGEAEFVSPESIAISDDGTVYISDAGMLRRVCGNQVDSIYFQPEFLIPRIIRCYKNDVYILTQEWEDEEDDYYGIIRLAGEFAVGLYIADAKHTKIDDFTLSNKGQIYFIESNIGVGGVFLKNFDPDDTEDIQVLCELPRGTSALTINDQGRVYLANKETGTIQFWCDGELSYFAGVENEKAFIDGAAPLFYSPQRIKYADNFLFVWDYNVLRRISDYNGVAGECITIAGEANPTFDLDVIKAKQKAEDIVLPNSELMDFVAKENNILLTDPKRGVVWSVE